MSASSTLRPLPRVLLALFAILLLLTTLVDPKPVAFAAEGDLDPGFVGTPLSGLNAVTRATAVQPDGKILIGGDFTSVHGSTRNYIARLNADGSLDTTFAPNGGANRLVRAMALQADGKILIGGDFTIVNGSARNYIARLNADGSLDPSFAPTSGANNAIESITLQPNGRIVIGGNFTIVNGVVRNRIARLNLDGSLDTSFAPVGGMNENVTTTALQPDGKIVVGGGFSTVNGVARNRIARLNPDGSLDTSFAPGADYYLQAVALQTDGKILIGGRFSTVNGVARNFIARLNPDGSLDTAFAAGTNNYVHDIAVQAHGKIVIGGDFTTINGAERHRMTQLNPDGTLDATFASGANNTVYTITIPPDGRIIAGGEFTVINGVGHHRIVRFTSRGSLDPTFLINHGANNTVLATVGLELVLTDGCHLFFGKHEYYKPGFPELDAFYTRVREILIQVGGSKYEAFPYMDFNRDDIEVLSQVEAIVPNKERVRFGFLNYYLLERRSMAE
jgi:uncharacterized delta-60 repeat protein